MKIYEPMLPTARTGGFCWAVALILLTAAAIRWSAAVDTIYLTNGRVICAAAVRIEGDRVISQQLGGEVSIPRSSAARIVEDARVEQRTRSAPDPTSGSTDTIAGEPGADAG